MMDSSDDTTMDSLHKLASLFSNEASDSAEQNQVTKNFVDTPYCTPDELRQSLLKVDHKLSFFHLNIRSLSKNFEDLKFVLSQLCYQFSFICLTETWSQEDLEKNPMYHLPNYKIVYQNRKHKNKGGGLCMYIHESFKFKIREDMSVNSNHLESFSVEIEQSKMKNLILTTMYRPPSGNINAFMTSLETYFSACMNKQNYTLGDFNLNLTKYSSSKSVQQFVDLIFEFGSIPTINKPTRITRKNETTIDNIITNSVVSNELKSMIVQIDISDHFPVILFDKRESQSIGRSMKSKNNCEEKIYQRSFSEQNLKEFRGKLIDYDWSFLYEFKDAEQAFEYFTRIFFKLFNESFPKKEVVIKPKRSEPWITKGLIKSSKRKQRLYENFLRNKTRKNENIYKRYRNNFNKTLKLAKRLYVSDLLNKYSKDIKMTWKTVNDLIGRKQTSAKFPETIIHKKKTFTSKNEIAEVFNNFFSTVGSDLAKKIPISETPFTNFLNGIDEEMSVKELSNEELKSALKSLEPDKSPGFDEISPKIVKFVSTEIFKPFKYVINLSLMQGRVPDKLKIARVVPVYKDGDRTEVSNYRPISILTCFSKVYERIMHNRLSEHLEINKVLYSRQFGFQARNSTDHAALVLSDSILSALEKNEFLLSLFIDLSKAFDTVDHNILLQKLEYYGVRNENLKWFKSYLHNRRQFVTHGETLRLITCGVPQGSILGPLLFLIYINDIAKCSSLLSFILFADDTTAFFSGKKPLEVFRTVNEEIPKLQNWFYANKLSLNALKTKYILFHKTNMEDELPLKLPNVTFNTLSVERVDKFKFLGIFFDENMSWKHHIAHVEKKLSSVARMIYKARSFLKTRTLKLIFDSMAQSYVNYGNIVWASTYHTNLKQILIKQKHISRMIYYKGRRCHARPLMKDLRALNVYQTNIYQTLLFMIKSKNKVLPNAFSAFFKDLHHKYPTRYANDAFVAKNSKTKQVAFRISSRGPFLWNSLKSKIPNVAELGFSKIKHYLKTMLLDMDNELAYF